MRPNLSFAVIASLLVSGPARAGEDVKQLLGLVDDLYRGGSSQATLTMQIKTASWERTLKLEVKSQGNDKALVKILEPAKDQGTLSLRVGDNLWTYLPKVDRTIKVPAAMMSNSWMGSHFTNDDLVQESRLSRDYDAKLVGTPADKAGKFVIELTPKPNAPVVWGKLVLTLSADKLPLEERYYDEKGKLVRTLAYGERCAARRARAALDAHRHPHRQARRVHQADLRSARAGGLAPGRHLLAPGAEAIAMPVLAKIAWRNVGRQRRRSLITAAAMAVGVAMSMAAISLTDGMYGRLYEGLVRMDLGDVQVHTPVWPKRHALRAGFDADRTLKKLDALPLAAGVAPRAYGFALLGLGEQAAGVRLAGVDPAREDRVSLVHRHLVEGHDLDEKPGHEIVLGRELARTLHAKLGDELVAVTQAADGSMGNDLYKVVGIFSIGSAELDRGTAFMHLSDLQELLVIPGLVHEVALTATERGSASALADQARAALGPELEVKTWRQLDPTAATMLSMQDAMAWLLLTIVFAVAAFGVLNTMLMAVFERTHELGVLRALGLTPVEVVRMVMFESVMLSGLAGLAGVALGGLLDLYLVRHGLDLRSVVSGFSWAGVSFDPVLHGEVRLDRIWTIAGALALVAVLSALWPAVRAARLQPTSAMREA